MTEVVELFNGLMNLRIDNSTRSCQNVNKEKSKKVLRGGIFLFALVMFLFLPKKVFAAYSFSVNSFPQSIDANSQQDIDLGVTAKFDGDSEYYLRAAFSHPDGPSAYFGYTNGYNGTEAKSFYKITTDENGDWSGVLKVKPDIGSQYFKGEGTYDFKIGYYTAAGNGPTWKYENTVFLAYTSPSPTPTLTPAPSFTPTPTEIPPTETPVPTATPSPISYSNIYISEFMANPEGEDEWVELYNDNDSEVDLYGWMIDDELSGNRIFEIKSDNKISGKSYKRYYLGSDAFLNNTTDKVRLLDGSGATKDEKSYPSTTKGKSWSKDSSGDWCQMVPTPNSANSDCPNSTSTLTLSPTPTKNLTPTPTPKTTLTPSRSLNASVSGEVMGEEAASGENKGSSDNSQDEVKEIKKLYQPPEKKRSLLFSLIAIGGGLALIFFSVFSYLKSKQ